jgi:Type IV secretion system pilin
MFRNRWAARARHTATATAVAATVTVALVLFVPGVADATPTHTGQVVAAAKSLPEVISGLQTWLMGILAALASLYLVLAGVYYVTAGGDPAQVMKAKTALRNALLGYGLAVLAPVLLSVAKGIVGG